MKIVKIVLVMAFAVFLSSVDCIAGKADDEPKVSLVDGLYMYLPHIDQHFRPLFIIEKGKFIDPYALYRSIGKGDFSRKYSSGKRFEIYTGSRKIGRMRGVVIEFAELPDDIKEINCSFAVHSRDLIIKAEREAGDDLVIQPPNSEMCGTFVKYIAMPGGNQLQKVRIRDASQDERSRLFPIARNAFSAKIKNEIYRIQSREAKRKICAEWLPIYQEFFDAQNKFRFGIGVYTITTNVDCTEEADKTRDYSGHIVFYTKDGNTLEKMFDIYGTDPAFCPAGTILIAGNDSPLVMIEKPYPADNDRLMNERETLIYGRHNSEWKTIYKTMPICREDLYRD